MNKTTQPRKAVTEMTDNEIIKYLESIISRYKNATHHVSCIVNINILKEALDTIKEQKAEIESLKVGLAKCSIRLDNLYKTADEIESAAIKKFAERLKEKLNNLEYHENSDRKTITKVKLYHVVNWIMREVVPDEINKLVKERTEVQE